MISVAMAVYNGEKFIEEQLNSIRDQEVGADEVVICDDCSTDCSFEIIRSYIEHNNLINWNVYKNKENLGYFKNFFKAIFLCNGDTIYLADQDDKWNLKKISECEKILRYPEIFMVQTNYIYIDSNSIKINVINNYHNKMKSGDYAELTTEDMCKFAGAGFTMAFRKEVKEMIHSNELDKCSNIYAFHDVLIGLVSAYMGKCVLINNIYDEHRLHLDNVTQKFNSNSFSDRTKKFQIKLLNNRINRFDLILQLKTHSNKIEVFKKYKDFCDVRLKFLVTGKMRHLIKLIRFKDCYYDKRAIFLDILFALNMERIVKFILNKFKK